MYKMLNQYQKEAIRNIYVNYTPNFIRSNLDKKVNLGFPNYYRNSEVIFIHVPKAAGSSIAHTLYGQSIAHMPADFFIRANEEEYKSKLSFAVVRNPWLRVLSAYNFVFNGGTKLVPVENALFYKKFTSFECFIKDYLVEKNVNELDHVFREQCYYVCDSNYKVLVNHLGKLENLSDTEGYLSKIIGGISFPKLNKSVDVGREIYTNELVDIVAGIYKNDIELFGYEFQ